MVFTLFFATVFVASFAVIVTLNGRIPTTIDTFDLVLVSLATFRLTRLFVYDKIMEWFRDFFFHVEVQKLDNGEEMVIRHKLAGGPLRTVSDLLTCPWCFGVWSSATILFFYFLTPLSWYPILMLAVAGIGSFLQILMNVVGWTAERQKQAVEQRVVDSYPKTGI